MNDAQMDGDIGATGAISAVSGLGGPATRPGAAAAVYGSA